MTALVFALSFVMAFLLFAVQPMATKMVLPALGGTPAVWHTAMLTFQLLLLAGYAYAHGLVHYMSLRGQRLVHGLVIALAFACLPLSITLTQSDALMRAPVLHLILGLATGLALPFFALAATAPLLQAWVSRSSHPLKHSPYVLYSASNLGSLSALIGYLILFEPLLTLPQQSYYWSMLFMGSAALLLLVGWRLLPQPTSTSEPLATTARTPSPAWSLQLLWIGLAFLGSSLSLSVTGYLTTDLAAVPLLWVVPLALYLLSFVDAFKARPLLVPFALRAAPLIGMILLILYAMKLLNLVEQYAIHVFGVAILMFGAHGCLARLKPQPEQLTRFYFCLAIGGALGGVLNALVAPFLFSGIIEYPLTLLLTSLTLFLLGQWQEEAGAFRVTTHLKLALRVVLFVVVVGINLYLVASFILRGDWMLPWHNTDYKILLRAACVAALLSLLVQRRYASAYYGCALIGIVVMLTMNQRMGQESLFKERNFFGVTRVVQNQQETALFHNTTMHSFQLRDNRQPPTPTAYYSQLGAAFAAPAAATHPVAVIGLGAGTMQCYAREDQTVDFIDINPTVLELAQNDAYFTFLRDCPGKHRLLLGDGRVMLSQQESARYGVIVLDAFSSDAIPTHLLTTEAFQIYLDRLAQGGVILVHITNRYLRLEPQLAAQAKALNLVALSRNFGSSLWVMLARSSEDLTPVREREAQWLPLNDSGYTPWTDQYVNMLPYFMLGRQQPLNL